MREEVEETVRQTRQDWQGSQAEMMKTVSGLQGTVLALPSLLTIITVFYDM